MLSHDCQLMLSHDCQLMLSHDCQLMLSHDCQLMLSHDCQLIYYVIGHTLDHMTATTITQLLDHRSPDWWPSAAALSPALPVQLFQEAGVDESYSLLDTDKVWHKAWFPVFFELSRIITRCKLDVRTRLGSVYICTYVPTRTGMTSRVNHVVDYWKNRTEAFFSW